MGVFDPLTLSQRRQSDRPAVTKAVIIDMLLVADEGGVAGQLPQEHYKAQKGGEKRGQSRTDYWGPFRTTDKRGEVALFSCDMPDLALPSWMVF